MSRRVDIILDLETLGTDPGAVVLQIGAIAFNRETGERLASLIHNIEIGSQLLLGMEINQATLLWWRSQPEDARAIVFAPGVPVQQAVQDFQTFWQSAGCDETTAIWARGSDFDPPIWAEAMRRAGNLPAPWRYDKKRDTRTAFDVLGFDTKSIPRPKAHQALEDVKHDLHCLRRAGLFGDAVRLTAQAEVGT